ncbi:hypothetical protein KR222_006354 [Zaprionus bogoriensis]|nr:hypothetical protein KR222_006354 [Zaprionus bogoriensis]
MSTRICVYKDCHNFYYRQYNSACNDITLFSFPKDPERAQKWRTLGQVHPKIGVKQLFMCSEHFDAKFLSTSKNRTILVGQALPRAYSSEQSKTATATTTTQQNNRSNNNNDNAEDCARLRPSTSSGNFCINSNLEESGEKQAAADCPLDLETVVMLEYTPAAKEAQDSSESNEVSIFCIKGRKYVQMSQDHYLMEKRQMLALLRSYRLALRNIKAQLLLLEDLDELQ